MIFNRAGAIAAWLPELRREVWILSAGQLLLFIGQGVTLVYGSIYFVTVLGFSATQVGLAFGSGGFAGLLGRFWAGNAVESPRLGRRRTLLLAAAIAALGSFVLAFAQTFSLLVVGNLLLGLGISFYWPATLAAIADLTAAEQRAEALALTRLADNLGLGVGALIAGQYIALNGSYPALFVGKGLAYLIFCGVIFGAIAETRPLQADAPSRVLENWRQALGDRRLVIYLMANLFVPVYAAQLNSTLPLFLSQFVPTGNGDAGFSEQWISYFFVWHALLKIVLQLPVIRWLRPVPQVNLMGGAVGLWAAGLLAFWLLGLATAGGVALILIGFAFIAVAEVLYGTSATALVGEIAPVDQRGVYFALESECWAVGFLIGPAAGGWALDHPETGKNLWLVLVITAAIAAVLVAWLKAELRQTPSLDQDIHSS